MAVYALDEILDFVTSAPTLHQIMQFTYSEQTLNRVAYLTDAEVSGLITAQELDELREFERAAHFMDELKIRAERRIRKMGRQVN